MQRAAGQIIPIWPRDCRWVLARPRECAVHWFPVSGCCWGIYVEDGSDDKGAHCVEVDDPAGRMEPWLDSRSTQCVPGTLAEDGDPLDLVVLGEEATFTGCAVTVWLLGVI